MFNYIVWIFITTSEIDPLTLQPCIPIIIIIIIAFLVLKTKATSFRATFQVYLAQCMKSETDL